MEKPFNLGVMSILFFISIWLIELVIIFSIFLLFISIHQAIIISVLVSTILSFAFIVIQQTMNTFNMSNDF